MPSEPSDMFIRADDRARARVGHGLMVALGVTVFALVIYLLPMAWSAEGQARRVVAAIAFGLVAIVSAVRVASRFRDAADVSKSERRLVAESARPRRPRIDEAWERGFFELRRWPTGPDVPHERHKTTLPLAGVDLRNAELLGVDLTGSELVEARLDGADLQGATLRDANLEGAVLRHANLRGADLLGANLVGADLTDAHIEGARLTDAVYDHETVWPDHAPPPSAHGAINSYQQER